MEASIHRLCNVSLGHTLLPLAIVYLWDAIKTVESFVQEADWPLRIETRRSAIKMLPPKQRLECVRVAI